MSEPESESKPESKSTDINTRLISAVQLLLDAYAYEATFPGGKQHLARENAELLLKEIQTEDATGLVPTLHTDAHNSAYIDPKILLSRLQNLLANPPGLTGIHCDLGHIGNQYVDEGYKFALSLVISHINHIVMLKPSC